MWRSTVVGMLCAAGLLGQPALRLKNPREAADAREEMGVAQAHARAHFLVQFASEPDAALIGRLREAGLRAVSYVPDHALIVVGDPRTRLDGLGVVWHDRLSWDQKLSRVLRLAGLEDAVVEVHEEADVAAVRAAVLASGGELGENPDLSARHILVRATEAGLVQLAAMDEVGYVFPASPEIVTREPVQACPGAMGLLAGRELTASSLAAAFGDGWDGVGAGSARLGYWFGVLAENLPGDTVRAEILRALSAWSEAVEVDFTELASAGQGQSLDILFARREHGDGASFDGPGRVIAHTYYPPPNPDPIAGDMHFDLDEGWQVGADLDVFSVALHEAGHALGLGHNDDPDSVMYPYYRRAAGLKAADLAEIRLLYAQRSGVLVTPGTPRTLEPELPKNPVTPAVRIVGPTTGGAHLTASATVTLTGTAEPPAGLTKVEWRNSRGGSGSTRGTALWSAGPIPLLAGSNGIVITATWAGGAKATASLEVIRSTGTPDFTAPSITITAPSASTWLTGANSITVKGTAADNTGVKEVTWSNSAGGSGTCTGTTSWSATGVPLAAGSNVITIRARDATGNQGWRTVIVTRR